MSGEITFKKLVLTQRKWVGKTLDDLKLHQQYGVTITRVNRADHEFTTNTNLTLQYGDVLRVVGAEAAISQVAKVLGNSKDALRHPNIAFILIGVFLGVILGSLPIHVGGLSAPIKLGLAGGPLIIALFISRLPIAGSIVSHFPFSANLALRELGIALFLACVGLKAGGKFVETLVQGDGFLWMAYASLITFVPIMTIGFIARKWLKINFLSICGVLAGSCTDPPALAFANSFERSNAPSVAYATVYPLVMILRILCAQLIVVFFH
jgi:putative transport protein